MAAGSELVLWRQLKRRIVVVVARDGRGHLFAFAHRHTVRRFRGLRGRVDRRDHFQFDLRLEDRRCEPACRVVLWILRSCVCQRRWNRPRRMSISTTSPPSPSHRPWCCCWRARPARWLSRVGGGGRRDAERCLRELRGRIAKRMRAKLQEIKLQLKRRMHGAVVEVGRWLRSVVQGWFNYHAVPGNRRMPRRVPHSGPRLWRRVLRRRSQKGRTWTWERIRV